MLPDISLSDLKIKLVTGAGQLPFTPAVESFSGGLSASAFTKIVETGLGLVKSRLPVDVQFVGSQLTTTGAEVTVRVKRSVLKAEIRAAIELSTPRPDVIRIRFGEIAGPAWVPGGMIVEKAIEKAVARPGATRAADDPRAIDVDPTVILKALNLPVTLAQPGTWTIVSDPASVNLSYGSGS